MSEQPITADIKLLPCPWPHIGTDLHFEHMAPHKHWVFCGCGAMGPICGSKTEAAERWNNRTSNATSRAIARAALELATKAATEVSAELKAAPDRDKMLGMYGANQVWHRIAAITDDAIMARAKESGK